MDLINHIAENIKLVSEYNFTHAERDLLIFDEVEVCLIAYLVGRLQKLQMLTARMNETGQNLCSYGVLLVDSCCLLRELNRETGLIFYFKC